MRFVPPLDQPSLDNKCLTFLVFDDLFTDEPASSAPAVSYSLETGQVWFRHPVSGERLVVPLRGNSARLAGWEPMTTDKLCLMATELGIAGDDNGAPGRVTEPELAAVVVSPAGFVLRWKDDGTQVGVSDIRRLADSRVSLTSMDGDWNEYRAIRDQVRGPGLHGQRIGQAGIGDGRNPVPGDTGLIVIDSLAGYGAAAASPVGDIGSDVNGEFVPEAADFVARNFGIDANGIDWREVNKARIISRSYSASASFDPVAACGALGLASVSSRAQRAITASPSVGGRFAQKGQQAPRGKPRQ